MVHWVPARPQRQQICVCITRKKPEIENRNIAIDQAKCGLRHACLQEVYGQECPSQILANFPYFVKIVPLFTSRSLLVHLFATLCEL